VRGNTTRTAGVSASTLASLGRMPAKATKDICKIYAESFLGADHLHRILEEAQTIANDALATEGSAGNGLRKEHDRT